MGKIEDLLMPEERIIKKQAGTQISNMAGQPAGDLYLTNKRLIFLHSKGWSLLSLTPATGVLLGKDIVIPLQDIKSVEKNMLGYLKVRADKEYQFAVSFSFAQGWVDATLQALTLYRQSPPPPPPPTQQQPIFSQTPRPQVSAKAFCSQCGSLLKPEDKFCSKCGACAT
jgi:hypothetical protein